MKMDQIIESFISEAKELLSDMERDLLALETEPQNEELIANIFRVMHTLKGSGAMYGFENIQHFTHDFESIYHLVREHQHDVTPELIDITLKGVDILQRMLNMEETGNEADALIDQLRKDHLPDVPITVEKPGNNNMQDTAVKVLGIIFQPDKSVFERGINPENALNEIREMGKVHVVMHENGTPWEEQKQKKVCTAVWEVYIITTLPVSDIEGTFIFFDKDEFFVSEIGDNPDDTSSDFTGALAGFYPDKEQLQNHMNAIIEELKKAMDVHQEEEKAQVPEQKEVTGNDSENTDKSINHSAGSDSLKVTSSKIDELLNLVSELVTSSVYLEGEGERIQDPQLKEAIENIGKLTKRFRDNALDLRLMPIRSLFMKFNRQVRDLSRTLGKDVDLIIEDHDTEIDKSILNAIENPLLHIIRNSLDHGIESPDERKNSGKKSKGLLKITSFYSGVNVIIQIQDDGKGIDLEKIQETAISKGFIEAGQEVSKEELLGFIMEPGFTTTKEVNMVSGRGVGMDVVKRKLNEVKGSLEIDTEKGLGTYITLKLPTTLSIIDTLMVQVSDAHYLIPLLEIDYCFNEKSTVLFNQQSRCLRYNDELIPFISLREKFNQPLYDNEESMVVVVSKYDKKYALVVDHIEGQQQAVIKTLGQLFVNQPYFSGGNILADGKIALILDTNYLFNQTVKN